VTLPQHFSANGYRAVGCGKIFHGGFNEPSSFDEYYRQQGDPMPKNRPLNGILKTAHFDWGPVDATDEEMSDYKMASWAIEQLHKEHDEPFFIACGLFRPHLPWYVPQKYFEKYPLEKITLPNVKDDDLDDVPPAGRRMARPEGDHKKVIETNNWRRAVQGYLASINFTDMNVGRLLDALDESGHADDTIVILWGDHGWHLGEKLHWRKFALWEEATRCPLIIAAPGVAQATARCERPVTLLDIYPTLVDLCGLSPREGLEGLSLRPWLEKPDAPKERPALTTHGRLNHSIRDERWRYIRYADGSEELYDHDKDPMEWNNLADYSEYAEVKKRLAKWLPKTNAPEAPTRATTRKEREEE
jgi:arylsulfatase A-like enzyme